MVFRGDIMVILTLISVSISSLCLIYFLSMVCIQLNYILNINLSMGMDVSKLYSEDGSTTDEDIFDTLVKKSAMFIFKHSNKLLKNKKVKA